QALAVTQNNPTAEKQLADALVQDGDGEQALLHYLNAVKLDPKDISTLVNLGAYYAARNEPEDATRQFDEVVRLTDHAELSPGEKQYRSSALLGLGFGYATSRQFPKALMSFRGANSSDPTMVDKNIEKVEHSLANQPYEAGYVAL